MNGIAGGSFHHIVDDGSNEQFVVDSFQLEQALVGVQHILQLHLPVGNEGEVVVVVVVLVELTHHVEVNIAFHLYGSQQSAGKRAQHGNEVNGTVETELQVLEHLNHFLSLGVLESLLHAHIASAGRGCLVKGVGRGNGGHMNVAIEQQVLGKRNQRQFNGHGKGASGRYTEAIMYHVFAVQLRDAIHEVVVLARQPEVARHVDDAHVFGQFSFMSLHEGS